MQHYSGSGLNLDFPRMAICFSMAIITIAAQSAQARGKTEVSSKSTADIEMWRLDCGEMKIGDISYFSDAFAYDGQAADISNGCYLIRNSEQYLLWDAGLSTEYLGNRAPDEDGWISSVSATIESQLGRLGLNRTDIDLVSLSHYHGDHVGQAAEFAPSTLLISVADADRIRSMPQGNARRRLAPWFDGGAPMIEFAGDRDVFGDGSALILAMPGHTPGHSALLVNLPETGPVLLTGDLFHFRSEIGKRNVSRWNTSRAETLASIERFEAIRRAIDPLVIVQHEKRDVGLLPPFPESAK